MGQKYDPDIEQRLTEASRFAQPYDLAVLLAEAARLISRLRGDVETLAILRRKGGTGPGPNEMPRLALPGRAADTGLSARADVPIRPRPHVQTGTSQPPRD